MRVLSSSLTGLACIATLLAATATPATFQPSALAFEQGSGGGVQLIDNRDRRNGYARRHYRGYRSLLWSLLRTVCLLRSVLRSLLLSPTIRPYYGPSVSFSFGF